MKTNTKCALVLVAVLLMISCLALSACVEEIVPPVETFTVVYEATEGGHVQGEVEQTVEVGQNASTVTAVASSGYKFLKWSDNDSTVAERTDTNIQNNIFATAIFEKLVKTFTYVYNNETDFYSKDNNTVAEVTIAYDDILNDTALIVPIREHFTFDGWYLDEEYTTQVANQYGITIIGNELFDSNSTELVAKWTVIEQVTYKILMVFVTEVQGIFTNNREGATLEVDYKMSDIERQICEIVPIKFGEYLNKAFNGLVTFEIDSYFTKIPLVGLNQTGRFFAYNMSEVKELLPNYRSILTTYCINDYSPIEFAINLAGKKYGIIALESLLANHILNDIPIESILTTGQIWGVDYWEYSGLLHYAHEFIHTAEVWMSPKIYEMHAAGVYYRNVLSVSAFDFYKLYLLNQAVVYDERVGIPYDFWKNNPEDIYGDPFQNWIDKL